MEVAPAALSTTVVAAIVVVVIVILVVLLVLCLVIFGGKHAATTMVVATLSTAQLQSIMLSMQEPAVPMHQPQLYMSSYMLLPTANLPLIPLLPVEPLVPPVRPPPCQTPLLGRRKLAQVPKTDTMCGRLQAEGEKELSGDWANRNCFESQPDMQVRWDSLWNAGTFLA